MQIIEYNQQQVLESHFHEKNISTHLVRVQEEVEIPRGNLEIEDKPQCKREIKT